MAKITLQGNPINTSGDLPKVGSSAPDFILVDSDLNNVKYYLLQLPLLLLRIPLPHDDYDSYKDYDH